METQSTYKVVLIFAAALGLACLVLRIAPRREMNPGGCGPRALHAVVSRLGNHKTEAEVLDLFPNHGFETTLEEMETAVPQMGLRAKSRSMSIDALRKEHPVGVLHIDDRHFVALVGYEANAALIVDSLYEGEEQPVEWLWDDLKMRWDGAILVVSQK